MFRRSFVVVGFVLLALTACGGEEPASVDTSVSSPGAAVFVTTDCGKQVVIDLKEVAAGQTAMRALDRVADIETASGGKFVTGIDGIDQDVGKKLAWLFYVNGDMAQKGATEIELGAGDVEWWDLHNYEQECASVPAEAK